MKHKVGDKFLFKHDKWKSMHKKIYVIEEISHPQPSTNRYILTCHSIEPVLKRYIAENDVALYNSFLYIKNEALAEALFGD